MYAFRRYARPARPVPDVGCGRARFIERPVRFACPRNAKPIGVVYGSFSRRARTDRHGGGVPERIGMPVHVTCTRAAYRRRGGHTCSFFFFCFPPFSSAFTPTHRTVRTTTDKSPRTRLIIRGYEYVVLCSPFSRIRRLRTSSPLLFYNCVRCFFPREGEGSLLPAV